MYGDTTKTADTLIKAAKILEAKLPEQAKLLYDKGCDMAFPLNTPKERISQLHPGSLEIFRDKFNFLLKQSMYIEALAHAERMISLFQAFGSDNSMTKTMLAITILYLTLGDVVKAEQTYLQEHLNNTTYLNSKECKLADELVMAFKNFDVELLDKTLSSPDLNYIDREIQNLARKLTLKSKKKDKDVRSLTTKMDTMQVQSSGETSAKSALFGSSKTSSKPNADEQIASVSVSSAPVDMIKDEISTVDGTIANNDNDDNDDDDDPFDADGNLKADTVPTASANAEPEEDEDEIDLT